ncbi:MAG: TM0106 family RecB-like putative nuclease, partial [Methylocella sp.]
PPPSPGDIFLDLEGDPFVGEGGLEYLFGYAFRNEEGTQAYTADWAFSRAEEKQVFERFIDFVTERLKRYPDLHIYHYAPYEPGALKRLMGRYATREEEIDRMLRSRLFVDLYAVVRHGVRASVESYSIKKLEPLYEYARETALSDANAALAKVQACLELGDLASIDGQGRQIVQGYNRDDCLSTWRLRDWLEGLRFGLIEQGVALDRPIPQTGDPGDDLGEWQKKIDDLILRLTADVPVDVGERNAEQQGRWLLAHTLDWHRREKKALWWEFFRLADLAAEELLDERAGLSGLSFTSVTGGTTKAPVHRYHFPPQETELRGDEDLRNLGGAKLGKVVEISLEERWIDIKKRGDSATLHPEAVFAHKDIDTSVLAEALVRIGHYVAENGIVGEGSYQAARDLLMREAPRIGGEPVQLPDETPVAAALRLAPRLSGGVLPIQGPPGAGKTHVGARMIRALVKSGFKVGITANSHKVIRNILDEVIRAADETGVDLQCIQKVTEKEDDQHRLQFGLN